MGILPQVLCLSHSALNSYFQVLAFIFMYGLKFYLLNFMTLIKPYKMLIVNFLLNWNGLFLVFLHETVVSITMILLTSESFNSVFRASNLHVQMPSGMFLRSFKLSMTKHETIFNSLLLLDCSDSHLAISWWGTSAVHSAFLYCSSSSMKGNKKNNYPIELRRTVELICVPLHNKYYINNNYYF